MLDVDLIAENQFEENRGIETSRMIFKKRCHRL